MLNEYRATSLVAAILIFAVNAPAIVAASAVGEGVGPIRHTGAPHTRVSKGGGGCPDWACTVNGRALTGIALSDVERLHLDSTQVVLSAKQAMVDAPRGDPCDDYGCGTTNGTQLTGLALHTIAPGPLKLVDTEVTNTWQSRRQRATGGRSCPEWQCTTNGRALTGIALPAIDRIQLRSDHAAMDRREAANRTGGGGGCPTWMCTTNGRTLTGIALSDMERFHVDSTQVVLSAKHAIGRGSARGGCEDWGCGTTNGTQLTGLALPAFAAPPRKLSEAEVITTPNSKRRHTTGSNCPECACTTNGSALTGLALPDVERLHPSTTHIQVSTKQSTSSGPRHGCDDFGCGTSNGAQLTGVALPGHELQGIKSRETDVRLARPALQ
jgi:hypothetical protein